MSKYSGKCDIYDSYLGFSENEEEALKRIQNTDFYVDGKKREINTIKDLIPFSPCIEGIMAYKDGRGVSHLSSRSYVLCEEDEIIGLRYKDAKRVYRRLKRNKKEITPEAIYDGWFHWGYLNSDGEKDPVDWMISQDVAYNGEDAYTGRFPIRRLGSLYRKNLYDTMIEYGYTQDQAIGWVYENDIRALEEGYKL